MRLNAESKVAVMKADVVSNVGEHVVDTVSEHLDFMSFGATTLTKYVVELRRGVLLLMLTNKGWVDGNGSNSGGGFGKPRGGRETRGGGDGLEGPSGQLSMV
ncbi:hypothetical protein Tco_0015367 [Tanacetum coccineum]